MKLYRGTEKNEEPAQADHDGPNYPGEANGTAGFLFSRFGNGSERKSTFVVELTIADVWIALDEMVANGSEEAEQVLADLALGRAVRKLVAGNPVDEMIGSN